MRQIAKPDETLMKILPEQKLNPDTFYTLSQFALPYDHEGRHILCNNLTREIVELEQPLGKHFTAQEVEHDADLFALMRSCFLVPENKDECAFYEGLSLMLRTLKKHKGIKGYTILPTLACNAQCVYCYEAGMEQTAMTLETAEQTVRYILQTKAKGPIQISWFGGEPLLGEAMIDRICDRLQEEGVEYTSNMITNGSLLTEAAVDKMAGKWKLRKVQISMDGAEPDYISRKKYRKYKDFYHTVMQAVDLLTARNIQVSIRCNIDENNFDGIPQFLSDLSAAIQNKGKVHVYLAPLDVVRMGRNDLSMWKKVMDMEALIGQAGFGADTSHGRGIQFRINHCMADAGNVVITPDGCLYPCEHCPPESRFGNIRDGVSDEKARADFCRTDQTRERCRTCPFLPDCTSFAACPVYDTHCREIRRMEFERTMMKTVNQRSTSLIK